MKLLLIHADFIEYEPKKKALKSAEEISEKGPVRVEEVLVAFCSVEKRDEGAEKTIVEKSVKEILGVQDQVKAKNIVVYPFVHLSQQPSSPAVALEVVKGIEEALKKKGENVKRSPFGWYKSFDIKCKGHPLAELSRDVSAEGGRPAAQQTPAASAPEEKFDPKQLLREVQKTKLDRVNLKDNDHRILGQRMDLFSFSEVAPGMVFWHDKGLTIYNELVRYWREVHREAGYQEISTPQILDKRLWQISGHWEKYKDNIFLSKYEGRDFAVKPMNCPGGMMVYRNSSKSYKDLPLRVGELGVVHRQELSGVLSGLFRAIKFTQDDAHIFCTEEQLEKEIAAVMDLEDKIYKKFGFEYKMELSTRPEKRIGDDKLWDKAEKLLEAVLKKRKVNYKVNAGDGAFYGPKIDFHLKDSQGRTWQCGTIQLDFAMPERFDLTYNGEDNALHRPAMLHRTIYGSLERFIGILLEHLNGSLPVWLSPVQVRILSFTNRNEEAARKTHAELAKAGIRAELDIGNNTVEYKVREAELQRIPYILVVGDKEEKAGTVAVRKRGEKKVAFGVKLAGFKDDVLKEIADRK
ncbi:MAG: threonine--tRNA ligase [Candidatus Aenigmatarchaeota archaeon]